jgi:hypothetical protein
MTGFSVLLLSPVTYPKRAVGLQCLNGAHDARANPSRARTATAGPVRGGLCHSRSFTRAAALCRVPVGVLVRCPPPVCVSEDCSNPEQITKRFGRLLRQESTSSLSRTAERFYVNKYSMTLYCPPAQRRNSLKTPAAFARGQDTVWKRWGPLKQKIPYGARHYGPVFTARPGTGQNLSRRCGCNELGLEPLPRRPFHS